jgi:hypothetical protein
MRHVAVAEDLPFAAALANAFDHGIVVERVRQNQAIRNQLGDGGDAGLVRDVARGEQQRRLLAVQIGQFLLELHQRMMGAGDVAGAAGAGADPGGGLDHGADHLRMLPHAEIVVGAPDHDIARPLRGMPHRMRKPARNSLEIGEDAVAPLVMQAAEGGTEEFAVIHRKTWSGSLSRKWHSLFRAFPGLMSSRNCRFRRAMDGSRVASSADQNLIPINTLDAFYCLGFSRRSRNLRNGPKAPRFSRKNNPRWPSPSKFS